MKTRIEISDYELIQSFVAGDQLAFEKLIGKYQQKVYTSIYMVVKDAELADDVFQDTFIKVITKLREKKYNEEGKFLPWVQRIARNLCMDHFRKVKKEKLISNDNDEYDLMANLPSDEKLEENYINSQEKKIDVAKYIDLLPEEQKQVIVLRHYYDYSFKDIAEITNTNINTCLGRMRYALINLRKLIKKHPSHPKV